MHPLPAEDPYLFRTTPDSETSTSQFIGPRPFQQKAGVIYRIPCSGCPRVHVGQTGRTLAQRLKEHERALVSGHLGQSVVAEHAAQEAHDIDWEGATVMDVQQQCHHSCLPESWYIRSELNTMNRNEGNLPQVYDVLVCQSRSSH